MYSETKLIARYSETDQMGIIHHSNYAVWFEAGRTDFLRKTEASNTKIESMGVLIPLYEINCKFKKPAKYEDEIIVRTRLENCSRVRISFSYEVINAMNNQIIATGTTMHAWTDKKLKPINAEKVIPYIFNRIKEESVS